MFHYKALHNVIDFTQKCNYSSHNSLKTFSVMLLLTLLLTAQKKINIKLSLKTITVM